MGAATPCSSRPCAPECDRDCEGCKKQCLLPAARILTPGNEAFSVLDQDLFLDLCGVESATKLQQALCVSCTARPPMVAHIPCGHVELCRVCSAAAKRQPPCRACGPMGPANARGLGAPVQLVDLSRYLDYRGVPLWNCFACQFGPPEILVFPCGHLRLCANCSPPTARGCPNCGEDVHWQLRVRWPESVSAQLAATPRPQRPSATAARQPSPDSASARGARHHQSEPIVIPREDRRRTANHHASLVHKSRPLPRQKGDQLLCGDKPLCGDQPLCAHIIHSTTNTLSMVHL